MKEDDDWCDPTFVDIDDFPLALDGTSKTIKSSVDY